MAKLQEEHARVTKVLQAYQVKASLQGRVDAPKPVMNIR